MIIDQIIISNKSRGSDYDIGFWYHNQVSYPGEKAITEHHYHKDLYFADIIILMTTDANLKRFPFGLTRDFYRYQIS